MIDYALLLAAPAIKKIASEIISDSYRFLKKRTLSWMRFRKNNRHISKIVGEISELRMVKTILQMDRPIDFLSFYHPAKVLIGNDRVAVHKLDDLAYDGSLILEGTAGQGKSIFLRYLAISEFCLKKRIPIFLELRKIKQGQTLEELAVNELRVYGFDVNSEDFVLFAEQGKITFFLDGFDEVQHDIRQTLITNIEHLKRKFSKLIMVITSRPDSGISTSPFLIVYTLCELQGEEYQSVILRITEKTEIADAIISEIRSKGSRITHLLTTPLMVSLLVVRYRIESSLPDNTVSFYEWLFDLLIQRHDKNKGGWQRPKHSTASDDELLKFFNGIAFLGSKNEIYSFSQLQMRDCCRKALSFTREKLDAAKMLEDIIKITCLIIQDGQEVRFIHKSVQEYHAALFIKDLPDEAADRFYAAMPRRWTKWQQELFFLSKIDKYRFEKLYLIPTMETYFLTDVTAGNLLTFTEELALKLYADDSIHYSKSENKAIGYAYGEEHARLIPFHKSTGKAGYSLFSILMLAQPIPDYMIDGAAQLTDSLFKIKIVDLIQDKGFSHQDFSAMRVMGQDLLLRYAEAVSSTNRIDAASKDFEFDK